MIRHTHRRFLYAAAILLATFRGGPASADRTAKHLLAQADIFSLEHAADVQISPDGRFLAYVRVVPDIRTDASTPEIRIVDLRTQAQRALATGSSSAPRWSPDGSRIAYLGSDTGGPARLYVASPSVAAPPRAIDTGGAAPTDFVWSHDGTRIAFGTSIPLAEGDLAISLPPSPPGAHWSKPPVVITRARYSRDGQGYSPPTRSALFIATVAGGAAVEVRTPGLELRGAPCWSADDRTLIFAATPLADAVLPTSALYEAAASGGPVMRLTTGADAYEEPSLPPDGRFLAFLRHGTSGTIWMPQLWLLDRTTGRMTRQVGKLDRFIAHVGWTSGDKLALSYENEGEYTYAIAAVDGPPTAVARQGVDGIFSVATDGTIGFVKGAPDRPAEAAISHNGTARVVAPLNAALLGQRRLGRVVPFDAVSRFDGGRVPGWAMVPPGYRRGTRYPTILWLHGGPHGSEGPRWRFDLQMMAAAGYVVLFPNPRGSTSYGSPWLFGLTYDAPQHDFDDVMSIVDAAVDRGFADPKRLYVTGVSYGGEMTAWIVGHTDRFRAAVAEKPSVNFGAGNLENDQYATVELDARGLPWQHPDAWWNSSPISTVGNVHTPTMMIAGEDDKRTPPGQAQQFYNALKIRGVPTALVLYPEASHETLGRPYSQYLSKTDYMLAWFSRYK